MWGLAEEATHLHQSLEGSMSALVGRVQPQSTRREGAVRCISAVCSALLLGDWSANCLVAAMERGMENRPSCADRKMNPPSSFRVSEIPTGDLMATAGSYLQAQAYEAVIFCSG